MTTPTGRTPSKKGPNTQNFPARRTELGRWMIEFVRKLVAGEYAFYCTCEKPEGSPETFRKYCKNCKGFLLKGYWLDE